MKLANSKFGYPDSEATTHQINDIIQNHILLNAQLKLKLSRLGFTEFDELLEKFDQLTSELGQITDAMHLQSAS